MVSKPNKLLLGCVRFALVLFGIFMGECYYAGYGLCSLRNKYNSAVNELRRTLLNYPSKGDSAKESTTTTPTTPPTTTNLVNISSHNTYPL